MKTKKYIYYNDPSIRNYLEEIDKIPLLSHQEEIDLFTLYSKSHSEKIKQEIANRNLKLVVHVAKRYYNDESLFLDLIHEGTIGLLIAIDKFDVNKGCKFSTYAVPWINQTISRNLINNYSTIRKSVHLHDEETKVNKAITAFYQVNGYEPSNEELSQITGYDINTVLRVRNMNYQYVSLNSTYVESNDNERCFDEMVYDKESLSLEDSVINKVFVEDLMSYLTKYQRKAVEERFGFDGLGFKTYEEIATASDISRKGVQVNVDRAIKRLRKKI